jgi:hypothetical protein
MTPDDLGALFEGFEHSAFRLEARDQYTVAEEEERLNAFLGGRDLPPRTPANDAWLALVARATSEGRTIERVRVVGRPLTPYTRFEFAVYPENISAGEKIRVVERRSFRNRERAWAHDDFWLFDDKIAVLLRYDQEGRFVGVEQAGDVEPYRSAKQRALSLSVELKDFSLEVTSLER